MSIEEEYLQLVNETRKLVINWMQTSDRQTERLQESKKNQKNMFSDNPLDEVLKVSLLYQVTEDLRKCATQLGDILNSSLIKYRQIKEKKSED